MIAAFLSGRLKAQIPSTAAREFGFEIARDILPCDADLDGLLHAGLLGLAEMRRNMSAQDRMAYTFSREHWHWGVLEDTRTLAATRFAGGIVQERARDLYGHLAACQLARVVMAGPLFHEIVAIARTFLPAGYLDGDFRGHCSTLLRRATRAAEGELVTFGNHKRTPIYTYSKTRRIDLLRIMPNEERSMTRLIQGGREAPPADPGGRHGRAGGVRGTSAERRETARVLRGQGLPWATVAERMGLARAESGHEDKSGQVCLHLLALAPF